jgi:catechol-2,3-dioxygenase
MGLQSWRTDRRSFLARASTWAALIAAHRSLLSWNPGSASPPHDHRKLGPRILGLALLTAAPLTKMKEFYHHVLGLRVLEETPDDLTIAGGETLLRFGQAGPDCGKPFYHFAFNIPQNKILAARTWQKERTPLLPIPASLRDPAYPDDVVDYRHWNAHSIFFFDPAGNVVEYIARHDLENGAPGGFVSQDILYASEIGLVVDDVPATASKLKDVVGLNQYKGGSDQFTALGDERGLLLVMKRGRVLSFNAAEKKSAAIFRTAASVRGVERTKYDFPDFPYEIMVEG